MSNVRDFGATGDGTTDDTAAIVHAVDQGDGILEFPRGEYLISKPIRVELEKTGRFGIDGAAGTAKIVMAGAGPAFELVGTHESTADPWNFKPQVWARQRMPTIRNIEIEGRNEKASGVLIDGVMQATLEGVLLRDVYDGIRVHRRARNLIVSHCHIYDGRHVGIFLDNANLHQAIITGSHISYFKGGGIKIIGSEIRNLQITGNDIEYNYDPTADASADVWIDCSDERATVREATIVSNTIQAQKSPGGANLRVFGRRPSSEFQSNLLTVSGNLIGNQENSIHLHGCRGAVVNGNVLYAGHHRTVRIEACQNIALGSNCVEHRPHDIRAGVQITDSRDVQLTGGVIHDFQQPSLSEDNDNTMRRGLLEIIRCQQIGVSGVQLLDAHPYGIYVEDASDVNLSGVTLLDTRGTKNMLAAVRWTGTGKGNLITGCRIGHGTQTDLSIDASSGVMLGDNRHDT